MIRAVHSSVVDNDSVYLEQYFSLSLSRSSFLVIHLLFSGIYENVQMTCHHNNTQTVYIPYIPYIPICNRNRINLYIMIYVLHNIVVVHAIVIVDKNRALYLRRRGGGHPLHKLDSRRVSSVPRRLTSHRRQGKRNFRLGLCARSRVNNDESVLLRVWSR